MKKRVNDSQTYRICDKSCIGVVTDFFARCSFRILFIQIFIYSFILSSTTDKKINYQCNYINFSD